MPKPPSLQSFDTQNMETNLSFAFSNYCSVLEMRLSHFWLPWEGGDVESRCILKEHEFGSLLLLALLSAEPAVHSEFL